MLRRYVARAAGLKGLGYGPKRDDLGGHLGSVGIAPGWSWGGLGGMLYALNGMVLGMYAWNFLSYKNRLSGV